GAGSSGIRRVTVITGGVGGVKPTGSAADYSLDGLLDLGEVHRLRDHREGADFERFGHHVRVGIGGHDHDGQGRTEHVNLTEGVDTVHAGHREIQEDEIDLRSLQDLE